MRDIDGLAPEAQTLSPNKMSASCKNLTTPSAIKEGRMFDNITDDQ